MLPEINNGAASERRLGLVPPKLLLSLPPALYFIHEQQVFQRLRAFQLGAPQSNEVMAHNSGQKPLGTVPTHSTSH